MTEIANFHCGKNSVFFERAFLLHKFIVGNFFDNMLIALFL